MKKRVLIINTTFDRGGAAKVAYSLFSGLKKSFDIYFAYGRGRKSYEEKTFYFGNKIESFIHLVLVRLFGIEGYGSYFSTRKLIYFIKSNKFDVVNIHNLHGYYVNFFTLLKFLKQENIEIIYSVHDEWVMNCLLAHSTGCLHCKTGVGRCTSTYTYPKTINPFFNKLMLLKKQNLFLQIKNIQFICPSKWLAGELQKSFLHKFDIKVVYNGVDTAVFKPVENKNIVREKYNLPLNRKIIAFSASNLKDKNKGIDFIIELAKLRANFLFLGIGAGSLVYDNIVTTGYIGNPQKLAEMYALSDVFITTSRAETFSLASVEAIATGIPVVALDLPVFHEILKEGSGVVSKNNVEEFMNNILMVMNKKIDFDVENIYLKKDFLASYNAILNKYV